MILSHMRLSWSRIAIWGVVAAAAITGALSVVRYSGKAAGVEHAAAPPPDAATGAIGCLGRIEPQDGVLHVTAPYVEGAPPVVAGLRVRENTDVASGQVIAVLRGSGKLDAAVQESAARVEAARKRLAQAQEPPKAADVAAQEIEIRRLESDLAQARLDLSRYETLRKTDDVSEAETSARRAAVTLAQHSVEEARQRLRSLSDIRPADVQVAQADLDVAIAAAARVVAERDALTVRAPAAGHVLKIHAHAGEQLGPDGLLELARAGRMYVVAEVYEADIRRVRPGQVATITGNLLSAPLTGTVERIGGAIAKAETLPGDPAAFADTRVVPVHIRLADSAPVLNLIHGKVFVAIRP
jgi:HlyD family secretion protein